MNFSNHAQSRMQQRGIPPLIVSWLMEYGAVKYTHGARKRYFDKQSRSRLAAEVGREVVDRLGKLMNAYLVEAEDVVITAGHRTARIKR